MVDFPPQWCQGKQTWLEYLWRCLCTILWRRGTFLSKWEYMCSEHVTEGESMLCLPLKIGVKLLLWETSETIIELWYVPLLNNPWGCPYRNKQPRDRTKNHLSFTPLAKGCDQGWCCLVWCVLWSTSFYLLFRTLVPHLQAWHHMLSADDGACIGVCQRHKRPP